jgi:hypothetical protein
MFLLKIFANHLIVNYLIINIIRILFYEYFFKYIDILMSFPYLKSSILK